MMPASLRLKAYSSAVVLARSCAVIAWLRMRAVRLLVMIATTRKKNSVTTFSGSAMVKV